MNSLEKEFIPYELALEMKQIGFDEPCFGKWLSSAKSNWMKYNLILEMGMNESFEDNRNTFFLEGACTAPIFSQCFRWFREKYELYHVIHHFEHNKDTPKEFLSEVSGKLLMLNDDIDGFSYHSTYEEAESACIDTIIEIIKNK